MKAVIAIVLIVAFVGFGNAFKCYECAGGQECADPFIGLGVLQTDCSSSFLYDNQCLKVSSSDGSSVVRSCSGLGACSLLGTGCQSEGGVSTCCCEGNLCNSASTTGISYVTFASLIIASFLGL